ncbi:ATP-binding domain-containing protein [Candidatus Dojkabacteria bacterium]|uniref:ATP-binding domain-containing protein n=1 Tax=Candidatus Dojkabacteria bacterium TaxID=2099670 RepID=A0A847EUC5_9BACT|nr:ATP-binding domain-containing protein [Candidatus Dojkabacteria bacterium]
MIGCYEISNGVEHSLDINPTVYKKIEDLLPQMGKFLSIISLFGSIYTDTMGVDVLSIIDLMVRKIKYIEYIDDKTEEAEYKKENIEELKSVASSYSLRYKEKSLDMFLQEINLIEQEQNKNQDGSGNYVNLMTLHSSKGLEFNYVFIVGVEEGILPHSRSFTDENELEEERRLCYVGITRAKEKLYLTFAQQRLTREGYSTQIPSRFLGEIPQDICEYYSWDS